MLQSEFISHLARKGALRGPQELDGGAAARRRDGFGDVDWVAMTKLTHTAFADELATFYRCPRVQRGDLVGGRFAGERLSPRFLKDERLILVGRLPEQADTATNALSHPEVPTYR